MVYDRKFPYNVPYTYNYQWTSDKDYEDVLVCLISYGSSGIIWLKHNDTEIPEFFSHAYSSGYYYITYYIPSISVGDTLTSSSNHDGFVVARA